MASSAADVISTEEELDERLTRPRPELCAFMQTVGPRLVILGAGGKMGPTLAVLARRAADAVRHPLEVIAVSRFSDEATRQWLETRGVQALALDLLDRAAVARLPDARQVIYLVGYKFGTAQNPARTWAVNTLVPAHVAEHYPQAVMVALSTGNVYPLVSAPGAGSMETDPLTPLGEYANAAVARERIFDFHAQKNGTPLVLLRLNYAVDLRYGVLVDIARKVYAGQSVDVSMGYLNCIWQGDANDMILRAVALAQQPALVLNLTGSDVLSVRALAQRFGELFDRPAHITGTEANTALLSNSSRACALLGQPPTSIEQVMRWTAHWIQQGGRLYDRPTHFQIRDGRY